MLHYLLYDMLFVYVKNKISLFYICYYNKGGSLIWESCLNYRGVPRHILQYNVLQTMSCYSKVLRGVKDVLPVVLNNCHFFKFPCTPIFVNSL